MLNKELLMVGEAEPHMFIILNNGQGFTDPGDHIHYGYERSYPEAMGPSIGNVNRIPYWGSPDSAVLQALYVSYSDHGGYSTNLRFRYMIPSVPMSVTIKDLTVEFSNAYSTWLYGPYSDIWDFERSENMTLPVYFDPPRRALGSTNPRTNLRRGYYVEEGPWEAQDAEQGTSDDGRRRGVVDSTVQIHRRLLYTSNPMGLNRADGCPLERNSERGYCNDSNTSKEYPTTLPTWGSIRGHNRSWVYSKSLLPPRNSNHSVSKRGVSRDALQRVISKEALYA